MKHDLTEMIQISPQTIPYLIIQNKMFTALSSWQPSPLSQVQQHHNLINHLRTKWKRTFSSCSNGTATGLPGNGVMSSFSFFLLLSSMSISNGKLGAEKFISARFGKSRESELSLPLESARQTFFSFSSMIVKHQLAMFPSGFRIADGPKVENLQLLANYYRIFKKERLSGRSLLQWRD